MRTSILRAIAFIFLVVGAVLTTGCFGDGDISSVTKDSHDATNSGTVVVNNPSPPLVSPSPVPPPMTDNRTSTINSGVVRSIRTLPVDGISDTAATFHGNLDATWVSSLESGYFEFRPYGTTSWSPLISTGHSSWPYAAISGLRPSTTYEVQLVALVGSGLERNGGIVRFTTRNSPPPVSGNPTPPATSTTSTFITTTISPPVVTLGATDITTSSALLHGSVNVSWQNNGSAYVLISTNSNEILREGSHDWIGYQTDIPRPAGYATKHINGLVLNTRYWYRFVAITGPTPAYMGVWLSFMTLR